MKSLKANKAKLSLLLTLCVTFLCCVTTAFTGIFANKFPASAASVELTLGNDGNIEKSGLEDLFGQISGGDSTLDAVKAKVDATTGKGISVGDNAIVVTLGGLTWHVVYVSAVNKAATEVNNGAGEQGDIVATLWLEGVATNSLSTTPWNSNYKGGTVSQPQNIYGTNTVRGVINTRWASLIADYGKYISTPAQIGYQATEDYSVEGYGEFSLPNEAYGSLTGVETNWDDGYDYTAYAGYSDWQTDKLWFPSLTELGYITGNGADGIWGITNDQRRTAGSLAVWTRTGVTGNYTYTYVLTSDGGFTSITVNSSAIARPALHLNLSEAYRTELDDETDIAENLGSLNSFYAELSGGENTYKAVEDKFIGNASGTLTSEEISDEEIKVNFGGLKWTVAGLSRVAVTGYPSNGGVGSVGDIVATLWLDEAWIGDGMVSQWNRVSGAVYSSSALRNLIAGNSAADVWKNLTDTYGDYLATPAQIGYQITSIAMSSAWQYDKIWIPALSEVTTGGTWASSAAQKGNTADLNVWLRSLDKDGNPHYLTADGGEETGVVSSVYAVRPAIHVNLKVLALSGYGEDLPNVINKTVEYNGQLQEVISYGDGVELLKVEELNGDNWETVTDDSIYNKSDCDTTGVFKISDVGTFRITFTLKNPKTNFVSNEGSVWNIDDIYSTHDEQTEDKSVTVTVTPRELTVKWTDGEYNFFEYGYNAEGQRPDVFSYEFPEGEDAYDHLLYTYYDAKGEELEEMPVQAGSYSVKVKLDDTKYFLLVNEAGEVLKSTTKEYKIIAVSHRQIVWSGTVVDGEFVYEFNGRELTPEVQAFGLFDNDSANELNLKLTYATKGSNRYSSEVPVYPGKYTVKVTDEDGNYFFESKDYEIIKKKIEVTWSGDGLSAYEDYTFVWMYDGDCHIPQPTANVTGVVLNGVEITSLKLNPVVALSKEAGENNYVVRASLDASDSTNNYFELTGTAQNYRIIPCAIESIEWRYYSEEIITGEPSFQYIEVYGVEGPRMSAYGVANFHGHDENNQPVNTVIKIKLDVRYSNDTANNYWAVNTADDSIEDYYAEVMFATADDGRNCTSIDSLDRKRVTFYVTELVTTLKKIDVIWVVEYNGNYYTPEDLQEEGFKFVTYDNGVFTYVYNGEVQAPVAVYLKGNEYIRLDISESTQTDVGSYSVYLLPSAEFQFEDEDVSCKFAIKPLDVTVSWTGNGDVDEFVWSYDGSSHGPEATASSAFAGIDIDNIAVAVTSAVNAGGQVSYATVGGNYKIVSGATQAFTINKKIITENDIIWTDENGNPADANDEFIWIYDGKSHTLKIQIKSSFGYSPVLKVIGEAADVGNHFAYVVLDSTVESNGNFAVSEISHEFIITRLTVNKVTWLDMDDEGKIEFNYDGLPHVPSAVYIPDPDNYDADDAETYIVLTVWGEMTDAGNYVAYITDDYYFEGGIDKHEFTIIPAELEVAWNVATYVYNTKAQSPEVEFTGVAANDNLVAGTDYEVTAFANAGTHVSALTLTNRNYVLKAGEQDTCEFTIGKFEVDESFVSWKGDDDAKLVSGIYTWQYNAQTHNPVVNTVADADDSESFVNTIVFEFGYTGISQTVDKHTVTAYVVKAKLNGKDITDNLVLSADCDYEITPYEISSIIWYKDGEVLGANDTCDWTYDGGEHRPVAYYVNWDGEEVELKTDGGRINAGSNFTAVALQPLNCTIICNATRTFSVSKQVITTITWYKDGVALEDGEECVWDYNGEQRNPTATFTAVGADGEEFEVELNVTGGAINAIEKCTATASLRDVNNYEFAKGTEVSIDFSIKAMLVHILWEDGDTDNGDWTYTGALICPKAWLAVYDEINNELVKLNDTEIPVIGGAVVVGDYVAKAFDIYSNYDFYAAEEAIRTFNIVEKTLDSFAWSTQPDSDGNYNFTFGAVKVPEALTYTSNANAVYSIYLVGEDDTETPVSSISGAGTYKIVARSDNNNYIVPEDSATVTVVVSPKEVAVVWGELGLVYNGSALSPVAWFVDINGQKIQLTVTVDEESVEVGTYNAVASLASGITDYVLSSDPDDLTTQFTVTKNTEDEVEWNWTDKKWDVKETESDGGTDAGDADTSTTVTSSVSEQPAAIAVAAVEEETVEYAEELTEEPEIQVLSEQAPSVSVAARASVVAGANAATALREEIQLSSTEDVASDSDVLEPEKQQITFEKKKLDAPADSDEE